MGVKYAQFSLVGGSNALVDLGVLNLLLLLLPTRRPELLIVYNVVALTLANANSYLWNTLWTFRHQARHDARQVGLFAFQGLLNVAVGGLVLWLVAHWLVVQADLPPLAGGNVAKVVSMVAASTVSFVFLRFFVFRRRSGEPGAGGRALRPARRVGDGLADGVSREPGRPRKDVLRCPGDTDLDGSANVTVRKAHAEAPGGADGRPRYASLKRDAGDAPAPRPASVGAGRAEPRGRRRAAGRLDGDARGTRSGGAAGESVVRLPLPPGYFLDVSDPDVLLLVRADGTTAAAFSPMGATARGIMEAAEQDACPASNGRLP